MQEYHLRHKLCLTAMSLGLWSSYSTLQKFGYIRKEITILEDYGPMVLTFKGIALNRDK